MSSTKEGLHQYCETEEKYGSRVQTYIYVPYCLVDIIGARPISKLGSVAANNVVPLLLLEVADATRKQPSCDKVKEAGRRHQEDLHVSR